MHDYLIDSLLIMSDFIRETFSGFLWPTENHRVDCHKVSTKAEWSMCMLGATVFVIVSKGT